MNNLNIFITGGTKFLGVFLINEILKECNYNIFFLIKAKTINEAKEKIKKKLDKFFFWNEKYNERLIPGRILN